MQIDITPGRSRVDVGPPGGPTVSIPASCRIEVTGIEPYDVELDLEWLPDKAHLGVRKATYISQPFGDSVRLAQINKIALGEIVRQALEAEYIGAAGWVGVVDRFEDQPRERVDALVYLLAIALESPRPSSTVATARGLSPASGPKRVADARKAGLIPETAPGKATGA